MRTSLGLAGLMATATVLGSAVPKTKIVTRNPSHAGHFTMDVRRDEAAHRAAIARKTAPRNGKRDNFGPDDLSYDSYWFADLVVGGEDVTVLLDTGSADLWLVDASAGSGATSGVQTWDPSTASSTSQMSGENFDIGYGEGGNGVSGPVYSTPVCIGDVCVIMACGSATTDQGLGTFPQSGIMGLAFQGGNSVRPDQQETFMEVLAPYLDEPIFVFKLAPQGGSSQVAFGAIDFDYVAPMQEISVDSSSTAPYPYSWSYSGVEYSKDGNLLGTFDVVFDTGGPMTSAASSIVYGYYDGINGAVDVNGDGSSWTVPCGTTLPDLNLSLGSAILTIPGFRFYNGNTATTGDCTTWFVKENSATRGVIGDPFFAEHVVVFNQDASTISWGNQS